MAVTKNQQAIIDASAKLIADIRSQFSGDVADWDSAIVSSMANANAAQATKATPAQVIDDSFGLADAISAEIGNQKVSTLIANLQTTERDAVAEKVLPLIGDLLADYRALKALA